MFTLPSVWNLVISTIAFFIAVRYINLHLDRQEIAKNMTRSVLVFALASLVSWGAGEIADWAQIKIEGPQAAVQRPMDLSLLLNDQSQH